MLLHYKLRGAGERTHGPSLATTQSQADMGGKQGGMIKLLSKLVYANFWVLNNGIVSESLHWLERNGILP